MEVVRTLQFASNVGKILVMGCLDRFFQTVDFAEGFILHDVAIPMGHGSDGRRDGWSDKGMTLQELQQVFVEQGCKVAYNLDGGGSATMVLGDQRVNKTSGSRERDVSDIVYFTK